MSSRAMLLVSVLLAGCSGEAGERDEATAATETGGAFSTSAGSSSATGGADASTGGAAAATDGNATAPVAGAATTGGAAVAPGGASTVTATGGRTSAGAPGAAGESSDTPQGGAPTAPDVGTPDESHAGAPDDSGDDQVAPTPEPAAPAPTPAPPEAPAPTVGIGDIEAPAVGPGLSYPYDGDTDGYVLVKNWDFGADGSIRTIEDLNEHFQYHDQFNQISNGGGKYGAYTVAPDREHALHERQPIEGVNTDRPVREFQASSLKTYLVGLDGATEVNPTTAKAGCGSFQAKWKLPAGGSRLGMDIVWETRVRYVTPPYFWFAIWTSGNKWNKGAEVDVVESFGYDNGNSRTNFDGHFWHSSVVGGSAETNYHSGWGTAMARYGITDYDASEYHTWTWIYKADDSFESYNDGKVVQRGALPWTLGAVETGTPIDMSFIFDGAWGHVDVESVDKTLSVAEFAGKYYEWDFSRVYLRPSK